MKKEDVTCSECGAGFRRIELASQPGTKGEYHCSACGEVLEKFDGSALVAYRLTIHPSIKAIREYWADSNGRRNTRSLEVAMNVVRRRSARSGRAPLPSPGRPSVAGRDEQNKFWRAIAAGLSSEDAALEAGLSQPVGSKLFRKRAACHQRCSDLRQRLSPSGISR